MEYAFGNMIFIFLILSPILTMRTLTEEKKSGTNQLLLTSPIRLRSVVIGKYMAVLTVYAAMLLITFAYPIILYHYSKIDLGVVASGYFGILLIGAAFTSAGLFASSLTENQIVAAIIAFGILLLSWSMEWLAGLFQGILSKFFGFLSIINHFNDFQLGIVDTGNIFYYLSYIFIFLYLTIRTVEKTWSRG